MLEKTTVLVCLGLCSTLSIAHADTEPDPGAAPAAATPSNAGGTQLVLPKGRLVLDAYVPINLSDGAVGKPISISPDLWYGVTDDITVGLVHSSLGSTGLMGGVGTSLCLTGEDNGCANVYSNVGIDARYKLKNGPLAYAVDVGAYALDVNDPFTFSIKVGALVRWSKDKIAVDVTPNIFIGVTERKVMDVNNNRDVLALPVTGFYTVAPKIAVSLQAGLLLPFEDAGDLYQVGLSIGGHYAVNESANVTLAFSLPRLIAASSGGADDRVLTLGGTYAF